MARLSIISAYATSLLAPGIFSLSSLIAFDGQADQPRPVANASAKPEASLNSPPATGDKGNSELCQRPSDAEVDCEAITDTLIIFDASSSMSEPCQQGGLQKLQVAQWALSEILDAVPARHSVGLLFLEKTVSILQPFEPLTGEGKSKLRRAAMEKTATGSATLKSGLDATLDMLKTNRGQPRLLSVIVLTDGVTSRPAEAKSALEDLSKQHRIRFNVLCIGCNRTHHEEFNSLARFVNGRVDLVCSTKDLPQALMVIRRDYDDVWKCSQSLGEKCRQRLIDCCSELCRLRGELEEAQKEREALISAVAIVNKIDKTVIHIDDISNQILGELQKVSKKVQECEEKVQHLDKVQVQTNDQLQEIAVSVNKILVKLNDCPSDAAIRRLEKSLLLLTSQSETIDTAIQRILKRLDDWPPATSPCNPKLVADEIYLRTQFWLFPLVLLLIAQFLMSLVCLLRPGRHGGTHKSYVSDGPKPVVTPAQPNDLTAVDHSHESMASECSSKPNAPPANPSKYLGSGKHTRPKPPKPGCPPANHES